jgi:NAD(P)-dependent dehydrogenase (short-subunit alcohol dehydrogenase family)/acyl carrier protein
LSLLQGMLEVQWAKPPRLWSATRGAQMVGQNKGGVEVAQAPIWGLGRVVILEHPDLWGGLVDLDPDSPDPADAAAKLWQEIQSSDGEDQVAFRAEERYVFRLVRAPALEKNGAGFALHAEGTYLITGGLGSLGLLLARWLVDKGARHLVLTSRRGLPERSSWDGLSPGSDEAARITQIRTLEELGARVGVFAADVADAARMSEVFEEIERTAPPLRGIIHAAGVASERPVATMDTEALQNALRPKVLGSWVLHELIRGRDIDFLVFFSSVASIWGSRGLGHYAAANHFLDALAHHRRFLGLKSLSIDWGWWAGHGMATGEMERFFAQNGLRALPQEDALSALAGFLESGVTQRAVAAVDWRVFKSLYGLKRRRFLLDDIVLAPQPEEEKKSSQRPDLLQRIESAPQVARREILLTHVRAEVAKVLGFHNPELIEPRQGFFKMGMDSILTVQLRNRLEAALGRSLPPTVAFEYPTVETLSDYLLRLVAPEEQMLAALAPTPPMAEQESTSGLRDDLSEDELTALLADKLRKKP